MITQCPSCDKTISVNNIGLQACPKCGASILIGNPLKDEENKVVAPPIPAQKPAETNEKEPEKKKKPKRRASGVPWDNLKTVGFTEATIATTKVLLTTPKKFFRALKQGKDSRFIPLYGVMMAIIGTLFKFFWILRYFRQYFPSYDIFVSELQKYPELYTWVVQASDGGKGLEKMYDVIHTPAPTDLLFAILLAPLAGIVINALALFLAATILGSRAKLNYFYRVVGFSQVTALFNIIPFAGMIIAFFWQLALFFKSLEVIRRFSKNRAISALIIYFIISTFFSVFTFGG
ncbi:YIP1 family protein [bacterium]|nr:YIP1 family protein [bacterium]